ncbi:unnamed protein product, partial [Ceratitis capitata]
HHVHDSKTKSLFVYALDQPNLTTNTRYAVLHHQDVNFAIARYLSNTFLKTALD